MPRKKKVEEIVEIVKVTLEDIMNQIKMPNRIKEIKHDKFKMELAEDGQDLFFLMDSDLRYELYCEDILPNNYAEEKYSKVSFIDIVYSKETSDPYRTCLQNSSMRWEDYSNDAEDNAHLVCAYALAFNELMFSRFKKLEDVDRPIPFSVFKKLLKESDVKYEIAFEEQGVKYAGVMTHFDDQHSMFGSSIIVGIDIISRGSKGYVTGKKYATYGFLPLIQNVEEIGLHIVTADEKKELAERGAKYVKYTEKPTYCYHNGFGYTKGYFGDNRHTIKSRIMTDANSMRLLNSNIDDNWYAGQIFRKEDSKTYTPTVNKKDLWKCSPVIYGFAFGNKIWCRMQIESVSDIVFSETAFDELIVPDNYKRIFVSSLTNDMPSLDSIEDKGQGKIFLLYGAPGVGKTMTAESVAEYLKKPLYYVSVGELGINPNQLEEALEDVMEVVTSWDAVMLLDEVDVFAVKRDGSSIERNAMTAIFLRMLERYSGVLFMTTNLKDNLDPAFISRSTATIPYEALTVKDRIKIWTSILKKAESLGAVKVAQSTYDTVKTFAANDLNGRVIKNAIRLAYSLALSKEDKTITPDDINEVLALSK